MKYFLLILSFLSLYFQSVNAQSSLSGTITDEKNEPIFFSTIVLYSLPDSTISKTASTDELGKYKIIDIKDGSYFIEVSMLGYLSEVKSNVNFPEQNNATHDFKLKVDNHLLSEVIIKEKRPLLEQQSDRLVVNVEENITSLNSNLLDVMKKIPGVIVAGDRLSLAGSTNLTILINGKTTKYMDIESLMKDMPGDNVKKVEIIHQPGAEFDASGTGPIINIILKKNSLFGTNGSVRAGLEKGQHWISKTGISLSHYQGNVNINGGFGFRHSGYGSSLIVDRKVKEDQYYQKGESTYKGNNYRANLSVDWDITDRHRLGFQSRYIDHIGSSKTLNNTNINFRSDTLEDFIILSDKKEDSFWKLRSINPYYTFEIDTFGQKLDFDFNYITFWSESESTLEPINVNTDELLISERYNQPGNTKIFVGKIDYSYPFSKALKLQIGTKYSFADLDNNFQANTLVEGVWVNNPYQSNHYLFEETIKAAYTKLSYSKDKWSGTAGLRYEDSYSEGSSVGIDSTLSRSIKQLFPSASLSRDIIKGLAGIVSYSYRLDRPRYSSLNPFRYLLDPYTSQRGNPSLRPEFTHSMKFTLAFQKQPFFNVEYKLNNDAMVEVIEQNDETGEGFKTMVNLESKENFNINLGFPLDFIPKISGYGYIAANHVKYDAPYLGGVYNQSKWDFMAYTSIHFTLPWEIDTEVSGWYTTGGLQGMMDSEWMYGTSLGFSKRFLDKKLKLSLGIDNPFNRFFNGSVNYSNLDIKISNEWDARRVSLQASYKFGNQNIKSKTHKSSATEELQRAGKA